MKLQPQQVDKVVAALRAIKEKLSPEIQGAWTSALDSVGNPAFRNSRSGLRITEDQRKELLNAVRAHGIIGEALSESGVLEEQWDASIGPRHQIIVNIQALHDLKMQHRDSQVQLGA